MAATVTAASLIDQPPNLSHDTEGEGGANQVSTFTIIVTKIYISHVKKTDPRQELDDYLTSKLEVDSKEWWGVSINNTSMICFSD
jgi:hypothetical protein